MAYNGEDMQSSFETLYSNLNKAQKQAVDAIDGPVMVIAGPGTGKTSLLTLRIANILKRTDTPAHGILAITYTDAGVKAIREKLRSVIGNRAHDVRIHTFHSFAASIIAEHPDHFFHLEDMKQMTEIEQESIVKSILQDSAFIDLRPIGNPEVYVRSIISSIDTAKREALTPKMVEAFAKEQIEKIKNDDEFISTRGVTKGKLKAEALEHIEKCERTILFAKVYDFYEIKKREVKLMDFNDLIIELLTALRNDELLLRLVQEQFLYIHVDEHQDTNDAQNFIVALIAEFFETPNLFIVGDEKQAIYRFQGASVENFLLLQKRWPAMKLISLDTNYRSHQGILDASFALIEKNYEENEHKGLRVRLKGEKATSKIKIIETENVSSMESYLISQLRQIKGAVAIITRRNRELDRVIHLLEQNGIPVASERSIDVFHHPVGALFFDLLEYLSDPTRFDALSKTLVAGMWGVSFEKAVEIIKNLKSGKTGNLEIILLGFKDIRKELISDSPMEFMVHVAEKSGFTSLLLRDPSYVNVWKGIIALGESLVRESHIQSPALLMKSMLAYRVSAESRMIKVSVGTPDVPIHAMTAHGSKGLEFDHVFIPYAIEEAWVGKARGASFVLPKKQVVHNDIHDLRRLFYVALTRAKKDVTILTPLSESDGKILTPLRFISELDDKHVEHIFIKKDKEISHPVSIKSVDKSSLKLLDLTKTVLLESGLSVTALNHFLECPNLFLHQSILKLPQAPSISAEKGSAMHEALSKIWISEDRTVKKIEEIIIESVGHYLDDSFLASFEKELVEKDLTENAPVVAKALTSHFSTKGSIFTEHWVKTIFDGVYKNKEIRIPLHGKLDVILDSGSEVSVFDYKTRQAMSVNAIKGETKNSDGGYYRQLVFYRILLEGDSRFRQKRVVPSLVFVSPDEKGRCPIITLPISPEDIEKVKKEIQSLIESVWSGVIVNSSCQKKDCEFCELGRLMK